MLIETVQRPDAGFFDESRAALAIDADRWGLSTIKAASRRILLQRREIAIHAENGLGDQKRPAGTSPGQPCGNTIRLARGRRAPSIKLA